MDNGTKENFIDEAAPRRQLPKKDAQYPNNNNFNFQSKVAGSTAPSLLGNPYSSGVVGQSLMLQKKNPASNTQSLIPRLIRNEANSLVASNIRIFETKVNQGMANSTKAANQLRRANSMVMREAPARISKDWAPTSKVPLSDRDIQKHLVSKVQVGAHGYNNEYNNNNNVPCCNKTCKMIAGGAVYGRNSHQQQPPNDSGHRKSLALTNSPQPSTSKAKTVVASEDDGLVFCKDIYYKMLSMFPNTDPLFIKWACGTIKGSTHAETSNLLTDYLLVRSEAYPNPHKDVFEEAKILPLEEQYQTLCGIFPDADPNYLKKFVERNLKNPDAIVEFVQWNLDRQDYPTMQQYLQNQKLTEQQKQYTTGFSIEQFLGVIPDPVSYFEDKRRKQTFDAVTFEFLKSRYQKIKITTIYSLYQKNDYHFTQTAKALDQTAPDMKTVRAPKHVPVPQFPLLQEMAYVTHRREILKYIANKKSMEKKEFETLKKKNMLLECQCCFDAECVPSKCANCENGHIFCHSCIQAGTETAIGHGEAHIKCFANCDAEFSVATLQKVLSAIKFSIILRKRQEAEVRAAGLKGLVSCPFCPFASIPPPEDKIFKCLNPDCMKESCRNCKNLNHIPLQCDENVKRDNARIFIEEKMTQALLRTCYKCKKQFFKEEGCNKMTCICGAVMCYICDKPVDSYSHFCGQGSDRKDLCPLYTDDKRLNAEIVRKEAELAAEEIRKQNPHVIIDTRSLLPAVPEQSKGPHEDVPDIDVVARRIAKGRP